MLLKNRGASICLPSERATLALQRAGDATLMGRRPDGRLAPTLAPAWVPPYAHVGRQHIIKR